MDSIKKETCNDDTSRKEEPLILTRVSTWAVFGIIALMLSHFAQSVKNFLSTIGK